MRPRPIRSRADARVVAHRIGLDAAALWRAVRHRDGRSVILEDEVLPIAYLRKEARIVVQLLSRKKAS